MSVQTEVRPLAPKSVVAKPVAVPREAAPPAPKGYWADRLTFRFWVFCFALLAMIHVFEGLRWAVLALFGGPPAP